MIPFAEQHVWTWPEAFACTATVVAFAVVVVVMVLKGLE